MINSFKKLAFLIRKRAQGKISIDEEQQLDCMLKRYDIKYEELKDISKENKKVAVCQTSTIILMKDNRYAAIIIILFVCLLFVSKKYKN